VWVGSDVFTKYVWPSEAKYPHFFPVNGPRTGRSVTTRATEPYPHHSSLFFGCDRVNGGNYWQEGLERGRIVPTATRLIEASGRRVVWEQDCRWVRPDAPSPLTDHRRVVITAPDRDRRQIDFDITLTALSEVRIEKSNHSLFSARMAPDLSVTGGGTLRNSAGALNEKETFGQPAAWADMRGRRGSVTEGLAIFSHPANRWSPAPWFTRDYGFFSPTPLNWMDAGVTIPRGESLRLRYRVIVHGDNPSPAALQSAFDAYWLTD